MNYAQLLIPDFSLILCGYLVCRYTALNRTVWEQVEALVYYFLFPVLLFHSIVKSPLDLGAASGLIGAGMCMALVAIALAYSLPHWPWLGKRLDPRLHAASAQVGFRFNSFIALALADKVAGPQGLQFIAVLIGFCVPLFNIGAVWPMARHAQLGFARELLRNPLIIGTASGLTANLLGLQIPPWLDPTVNRIGQASLALAKPQVSKPSRRASARISSLNARLGGLSFGWLEVEIVIVRDRREARPAIGQDRPEARPRLQLHVPGLGRREVLPRHVAEIVEHRQVRGGGEVGEA